MDDVEYKFRRDSIEIDDSVNGKDIVNDDSQSSLVPQSRQMPNSNFLYDGVVNIKTENVEHSDTEYNSEEELLSDDCEQEELLKIKYEVAWEKDDANVELVVPKDGKTEIVKIKKPPNRCTKDRAHKEVARKYLLYDKIVATIVDYDPDDSPIIEFSIPNDSDDKYLPIQCGICPEVMGKSKMSAHLRTHRVPLTQRRFQCIYCNDTCEGSYNLSHHVRRHTGIRPYACDGCKLSFPTKWELKLHNRRRHQEKHYICKVCDESFADNDQLKKHHESVHDKKRLVPLQNVEHNIDNIKTTKPKAVPEDNEPTTREVFTKYKLYDGLVATVVDYDAEGAPIVKFSEAFNTEAHEKLPVECGICQVVLHRLKIHHHRDTHLAPDSNHYNCTYCAKVFKSYSAVATHIRRHLGLRPYTCDPCKVYFAIKQDLRIHNRTRHRKKDHNCKVCGKSFAENYQLKKHQEDAHENKRRFKCDSCSKSYFRNGALQIHIRATHMSQPSNKICQICGVVCRNYFEIGKHRRQYHLHQTHFECNICNETFTNIIHFDAHKRSIQCRNNDKRKHEQEEQQQNQEDQLTK